MALSLLGLAGFSDPVGNLGTVVILAGVFVLLSATQAIAADTLSVRGLALLVSDVWGWRATVGLLVAPTMLVGAVIQLLGALSFVPLLASSLTVSGTVGLASGMVGTRFGGRPEGDRPGSTARPAPPVPGRRRPRRRRCGNP